MSQLHNARKLYFISGATLILLSAILYYQKNIYWYNPATIGVWFLFDCLSSFKKNKTTLDILIKRDYKKFIKLYLFLLSFGVVVEVVGSLLLHLWSYPKLWSLTPLSVFIISNSIGYLFYPIILMSFREMYNFIYSLVKNHIIAVLLSMASGIMIWEIPNTFSQDWVYNIPRINVEIFHLNIIVIAGWSILILGSLLLYRYFDRLKFWT